MAWTNDQLKAITTRDQNIIVSAGAGSGKTAVLSERILELVKEGRSVKNMLVLTFTNAAAKEMKERIYKKLKENGFTEEAFLVNNADITTFDSFSLKLVKKYFYLLNVSPNIKVLDETILTVKLNDFIDQIFDSFYESQDERFITLLRHNLAKDDKGLKNNIINIKRSLDLLINTEEVINNYENIYFSEANVNKIVDDYIKYITSLVDRVFDKIGIIVNMLEDDLDDDDKKLKEYRSLYSKIEDCSCYSDYYDLFKDLKLPQLGKVKYGEEVDAVKTELGKKQLKKLKDELIYESEDEIKDSVLKLKDDALFIIEIIKELNNRINEYKDYYSVYTFMDIAKMSLNLVKNFKEVKEELMNLTDVLVDEYQDTSDIQEAFISEIENNNLYMVGDIKQSIYRFRNANPYIFKHKYDKYSKSNGGIKIDLLKNFRSRSEVLDNINHIFKVIMTDEIGDADYKNSHIMNYGLTAYDKEKDNQNYFLEDILYEFEKDSSYYKTYTRNEIEIFACAKKIKELVDNTYTFDKNSGTLRKTRYSDCAILLATKTEFPLFSKIFNYLGIPLVICDDLSIKESRFAYSILNLLIVASYYFDNSYRDNEYKKALNGLLRSFIFEIDDETIYDIIKNKAENKDITKELFEDIDYKKSSIDIFYNLLDKFNVYDKISKLGNVNNSLVEIRVLSEKLQMFNDIGLDFREAVLKLKDLVDEEAKISYKPDISNDDMVKIMSIHHSKGLEFPYCFCLELFKGFNKEDSKKNTGFSSEYGMFLDVEDEKSTSIIKKIHVFKNDKEDLSERIRVFYVALTRAREKLFFIRPITKEKKYIMDSSSFNDLLNFVNLTKYQSKLDVEGLGITNQYKFKKEIVKNSSEELILEDNLLDNRSTVINKGNISMHKAEIVTKDERMIMDLGTNVHEILEALDLKNPDFSNVDKKYESKIKNILKLDLFKNINEANIYQEYEFYFIKENTTFNGIIDLLLEYDDKFVIIDYKLSDINKKEYYDQLKVYHDYIRSISNKKIEVYLLSIMKEQVKELIYE